MSSHQTIGGHSNIPHFNTVFEEINKGVAVPFILKYQISPSSTVRHVVPGIWKLDSQWSGHVFTLPSYSMVSHEQT
jgi:hypothetical protein